MEDNFVEKLDLDTTINSFFKKKEKLDYYKKETDLENKHIKELMTKLDLKEFETDNGLIAKMTISERESFNEPSLIEKLKELDKLDAIDLVEVINWDKIEDMIYNGKLDASILAPYKEVKEVVTLKVSKKKD